MAASQSKRRFEFCLERSPQYYQNAAFIEQIPVLGQSINSASGVHFSTNRKSKISLTRVSVSEHEVLFVTVERSPYAKDALVAGFPVGIISFQGEACLDGEVQAGLVLKVDADVVVTGSGGELGAFNDLAFGLRKPNKLSERGNLFGAMRGASSLGSSLGRFASLRMTIGDPAIVVPDGFY